MVWTVALLPDAENELTELWISSLDREAVTTAADQVDKLLRRDPESAGESRDHGRRILIIPPLVATYCVLTDDRIVQITNIRKFESGKR